MATMDASAWVVMFGTIGLLWGVASWALYRSLTDEERKLKLIQEQGKIDTYSPKSLRELGEWIRDNPDDPMVDEARKSYNDCVETLREIDESFYDWSDEEIDDLETLST